MEADVHGKNITQGLDMSGTISSSPGALNSSFIRRSEKPQRAATVVDTSRALARISELLQFGGTEAAHGTYYTKGTRVTKPTIVLSTDR